MLPRSLKPNALDTYDAASTQALNTNGEELAKVTDALQALLVRVYVLDDGRRVFKSADGITVYDDFGEIVRRRLSILI